MNKGRQCARGASNQCCSAACLPRTCRTRTDGRGAGDQYGGGGSALCKCERPPSGEQQPWLDRCCGLLEWPGRASEFPHFCIIALFSLSSPLPLPLLHIRFSVLNIAQKGQKTNRFLRPETWIVIQAERASERARHHPTKKLEQSRAELDRTFPVFRPARPCRRRSRHRSRRRIHTLRRRRCLTGGRPQLRFLFGIRTRSRPEERRRALLLGYSEGGREGRKEGCCSVGRSVGVEMGKCCCRSRLGRHSLASAMASSLPPSGLTVDGLVPGRSGEQGEHFRISPLPPNKDK